MTGSFLYCIGCLAVVTELLDPENNRFSHIPGDNQVYTRIIVVVVALCWPIFATILVISRFVQALRNG